MGPAKTIRDFIDKKGISVKIFAEICKIHPISIYRYLQGDLIHPKIARKIEQKTKGEIAYEKLTDVPRKIKK